MDESKTKTSQDQKGFSTEDSSRGDQSSTNELIDNANAAAKRLAEENDRKERLLREEQNILARKALGGTTAFSQQKETVVEDPTEYAKNALRGVIPSKK